MRRPELLIPAGDLETLKIAVTYGADAVYLGGAQFSLRAKAKNFSLQDLKEGIFFAHRRNVKIYVALNIFAHNEELEKIREFLLQLKEVTPDALIVSDAGILMMVKEILPDTEIHISTQWSNANYKTYNFWYGLGARKVVAARELTLDEIKEIRNNIPEDLQIECFVHGAMCISYSGKCLLSSCFTGKDSNHGECTHPCRWKYTVYEQIDGGGYRQEEKRYVHLLNSKDLCMIDHIPDLMDAGIDSFKIEGRMKNILYVASVTRAYRKAIDEYMENPAIYRDHIKIYLDEIHRCASREFSTGCFYGKLDETFQSYENDSYIRKYIYLGFVEKVEDDGRSVITQRNKFCVGDEVEVMKPDGRNIKVKVHAIYDENNMPMESAPHSKQKLFLDLGMNLETYDVLCKKNL